MLRNWLLALAAAVLGLSFFSIPAQAAVAPRAEPTGCTTSVEWVQQGNNYWQGKGNVQCLTGTYKVKLVCANLQTGTDYVLYGSQVVTAPATTTATCNMGNVAQTVQAVADPPDPGVNGCVTWVEWVTQGNDHYFGRGNAQCDTGTYRAVISCQNLQTGQNYVVYSGVVNAPNTATMTCYDGNVAQGVQAQPQ